MSDIFDEKSRYERVTAPPDAAPEIKNPQEASWRETWLVWGNLLSAQPTLRSRDRGTLVAEVRRRIQRRQRRLRLRYLVMAASLLVSVGAFSLVINGDRDSLFGTRVAKTTPATTVSKATQAQTGAVAETMEARKTLEAEKTGVPPLESENPLLQEPLLSPGDTALPPSWTDVVDNELTEVGEATLELCLAARRQPDPLAWLAERVDGLQQEWQTITF